MSNYSMAGTTLGMRTPTRYGTPSPGGINKFRIMGPPRQSYGMSYTGTGQMTKRKNNKKSMFKTFQQKVKETQQAKHFSGTAIATLLHNGLLAQYPTRGILQGVANNERLGDSVFLEAIKIKGFYNAPTTSNAYVCRIMVGYTGEEYTTALNSGNLIAGDIAVNEVFLPGTDNISQTNALVNAKAIQILYDTTIDVNSQVDLARTTHSFAFTVQLNKKFPYQRAGSTFGKFKNLVIIATGFAPGATPLAGIGDISYGYDLIFRD